MNQAAKASLLNIWTLIGAILVIYGFIIGGVGVYHSIYGIPSTALANLHPSLWWGAIMAVVGAAMTWFGRD